MYCDEVLYMWNRPPSEKWCCSESIQPSHTERFVCCASTIRYITYSTVGWYTASISDLGSIFTSVLCFSVNMAPRSDISAVHLIPVLNIIHTVHANMHSTYKHVAHPDTFRHTNMHASVHRAMHCTNAYACTYTHALIHH